MNRYPDERTRKVVQWMDAVDEIAKGDETALPKLLSEADASTLMDVYDSYQDILEDHKAGNIGWGDWDTEVVNSIRRELEIRGFEPTPGGGWDERTAEPHWSQRRQH